MAKYKIGSVDAVNAAIGDRAAVNVGQQISVRDEALRELHRFMTLLPAQASVLKNPEEVAANAKAAELAIRKKRLNREHIEELIRKITAGVAGAAALTNAIEAVQTAVTHLF
jgi:hypothetical protein